MIFYFSEVTFNLFLVFVFLVVNLRQVSLCKNANPAEITWRDLLCVFSQRKTLFRKSVMIGSGVLIQMRFTLSMVNRFYGA